MDSRQCLVSRPHTCNVDWWIWLIRNTKIPYFKCQSKNYVRFLLRKAVGISFILFYFVFIFCCCCGCCSVTACYHIRRNRELEEKNNEIKFKKNTESQTQKQHRHKRSWSQHIKNDNYRLKSDIVNTTN